MRKVFRYWPHRLDPPNDIECGTVHKIKGKANSTDLYGYRYYFDMNAFYGYWEDLEAFAETCNEEILWVHCKWWDNMCYTIKEEFYLCFSNEEDAVAFKLLCQ